jgi:hypothetical protein
LNRGADGGGTMTDNGRFGEITGKRGGGLENLVPVLDEKFR